MSGKREKSDGISPGTRRERDKMDRRVKIGLVLVSTATLVCLVYASLRENVFTEWRHHQEVFRSLLDARAGDLREGNTPESTPLKIHQIVLPDLGATDRCISCHPGMTDPRMAGAPLPYGKHPGDILDWHDENRFGCTVCHRGQGRALNWQDAKAVEAHWNDPLLPVPLTQSSCGLCHAVEEVQTRGAEKLSLGKDLFERKGCAGCHKRAGRGGTQGPDLSEEGKKVRQQLPMKHLDGPHTLSQWLEEHFRDPQRIVEGSQMIPPQLSPAENEALTIYMLSLQTRNLPESLLSPGKHLEIYRQAFPDPLNGEDLYARFCAVCHDTGTYGRYDAFFRKFIPALKGVSFQRTASADYVDENIRRGRPGTLMSGWGKETGGLSVEEIVRIRRFLLEREPSDRSGRSPVDAAQEVLADNGPGNPVRGGEIFLRQCAGCHGAGGAGRLGPALRNPVLQETATDAFLFATVAFGRRDTAMPAFLPPQGTGFTAGDVADLVAHLRALAAQGPATGTDPQTKRHTSETPAQGKGFHEEQG